MPKWCGVNRKCIEDKIPPFSPVQVQVAVLSRPAATPLQHSLF